MRYIFIEFAYIHVIVKVEPTVRKHFRFRSAFRVSKRFIALRISIQGEEPRTIRFFSDYVLVYEESEQTKLQEGRKGRRVEEWRDFFLQNLAKAGLVFETVSVLYIDIFPRMLSRSSSQRNDSLESPHASALNAFNVATADSGASNRRSEESPSKTRRQTAISNLHYSNSQETVVVTSETKQLHFVKLSAPWDVLVDYAEALCFRAPLQLHTNKKVSTPILS